MIRLYGICHARVYPLAGNNLLPVPHSSGKHELSELEHVSRKHSKARECEGSSVDVANPLPRRDTHRREKPFAQELSERFAAGLHHDLCQEGNASAVVLEMRSRLHKERPSQDI